MAETEGEEGEAAKPWYLVTCRIAFDDEDSLVIVRADSWQEATALAEEEIRAEREAGPGGAHVAEEEFYVNYVVSCGYTRPIIELSPQP
jgi:hypothetical protein